MEPENSIEDQLAPHRRVIKLPDGSQQEIVELTPAEAEAILGHPIPDHVTGEGKAKEPAPEPPADEAPPADGSP